MADTIHTLAIAFVGALTGGLAVYSAQLISVQDAYQEGRQSVLQRVVTVGGDPVSPCAIEIPLHVLADMVNSGVMLWHERCEENPDD